MKTDEWNHFEDMMTRGEDITLKYNGIEYLMTAWYQEKESEEYYLRLLPLNEDNPLFEKTCKWEDRFKLYNEFTNEKLFSGKSFREIFDDIEWT